MKVPSPRPQEHVEKAEVSRVGWGNRIHMELSRCLSCPWLLLRGWAIITKRDTTASQPRTCCEDTNCHTTPLTHFYLSENVLDKTKCMKDHLKNSSLFMCVSLFVCVCLHETTGTMCVKVPLETKEATRSPWNWNYRKLRAT